MALQKDIGKRKKTSDTFCIREKKRKRKNYDNDHNSDNQELGRNHFK